MSDRVRPRPQALRWTLLIALCAVISGCVSIPTSSSPQPIGSLERRASAVNVPTPRPGMDPESLVRDFLKASANPSSGHLAARQYLTPAASDSWDDSGGALILGQINVLTDARTDNTFTARIIGDNAGVLQPNGHLVPATGRVESKLTMMLVDGQWRIDGALPTGVMIDRAQFTSSYRPRDLFFPNASGEFLVADPRWLYSAGDAFSNQLVDLLVAGPSDELARAVVSEFPAGAALHGSIETTSTGGVRIQLTGLSALAERNRTLLAAQLIWTLNKSDVPGPFVIDADGAPLDDRYSGGWRITDVASLDPGGAAGSPLGLHVIRAGALDRVEGTRLVPVAGPLGTSNAVVSATISADGGRVAVVTRNPAPMPAPPQTLQVGDYGGTTSVVAAGTVISRPSFGPDRDSIWAVVDGRVQRWSRDATGTAQAPVVVNSSVISSVARGVITELRVSPDGARVAAIVGGRTVLAVVATATDGSVSLTGARDAAYNIAGQAVSLDWISGDTVVVARNTGDTPVVQVGIDGTPAVGLLSGNLTPPVTVVVGDNSTLYASDSRGILALGSMNGEPDQYWNEVAPTMGSQSIPVLPQ